MVGNTEGLTHRARKVKKIMVFPSTYQSIQAACLHPALVWASASPCGRLADTTMENGIKDGDVCLCNSQ